jgi:hypothetical protein
VKHALAAAVATAALVAAPSLARAEPPAPEPRTFASLMAAPGVCAPGTQVACSCPNGARGSQVCEATGLRFSLCACANVQVTVPSLPPVPNVPNVYVPDVTWHHPPRSHERSSGLGMLIGGGVALLVGTGNLVWGIERLIDTKDDPLGIVMIATGGVAMAAGLPLAIVGTVFLATRGLHPSPSASVGPFTLRPTATGLAFDF